MRSIPGTHIPIIYAAGALVLLFGALVVVLSMGKPVDTGSSDVELISERYPWINDESFVFENELLVGTSPKWEPYRAPREQWTDQEASEVWYDPQTIGIDVLDQRVEDSVSTLLEDVP